MTRKERRVALCVILGLLTLGGGLTILMQYDSAAWLLKLLQMSDRVWTKPRAWERFHLVWLAVCVALAIPSGVFGFRTGRKYTDRILFFYGIAFYLLELYKQLYSFYVLQDRVYDFGFLPFQFCSLPLYLCPLLPLLREGKIKDTLCKFFALYQTMGGCLVMGYPAFYDRLSLCVHTMLWHTLMISLGVYLLFARNYGRSWRREVLAGATVFLPSLATATLLNVLLAPLAAASPNPLNLYYMSPYRVTHFLVVGDVQRALGWGPALLTYALLFIFVGATLVFLVCFFIRTLIGLFCRWNGKEKDKKI